MNENSEDLLVWMFWSRAMSVRAQFSVHQVVRLESREGYRRSSPKQVFLKVYEKKMFKLSSSRKCVCCYEMTFRWKPGSLELAADWYLDGVDR